MSISRDAVQELSHLYEKRQALQQAKEYALDRNLWLGLANSSFSGGTRYAVLEALGGPGEFAAMVSIASAERIENEMKAIDQKIEKLGGES